MSASNKVPQIANRYALEYTRKREEQSIESSNSMKRSMLSFKAEKRQRLISIIGVGLIFILLLIMGSKNATIVWQTAKTPDEHIATLLWYASATLIALFFFSVSSLVWLYGQQRHIATLLFCFSSLILITFGSLIGLYPNDVTDNIILDITANISTALAIPFLTALLMYFPNNLFSPAVSTQRTRQLLTYALALITLGSGFPISYILWTDISRQSGPSWWHTSNTSYYLVGGIVLMIVIFLSARKTNTIRTRQQMRLFMGGILLSFVPILLLTVLPTLLNSNYIVNSTISNLFLGCFPVTLGYSILRYQTLVLDTYLRRIVEGVFRFIVLFIGTYLVLICGVVFGSANPLLLMALSLVWAVLALWSMPQVQFLVERLFFSEMRHYRNLISSLPMHANMFELQDVCSALIATTCDTLAATAACVFVLNDQEDRYVLPNTNATRHQEQETALLSLLSHDLLSDNSISEPSIDTQHALLCPLRNASRPLTLHELHIRNEQPKQPALGLSRYFTIEVPASKKDPLIVALSTQKKIIALLVVADRGAKERYAGPDFTIIDLLLARFIPLLQTARLTQALQRSNTQLQELNTQLMASNVKLTELDKLKDQFIATTSHELRTPLTAVQGFVELLNQYGDTLPATMQKSFLQKAAVACAELSAQVETIYEARRLDNEDHIHCEPININDPIREALDIMEADLRKQEREITVNFTAPITAMASTRHVREVMLNLIGNALKYSPQGTPIAITIDTHEGTVTVTVSDQGAGIPPKSQDLLFERFVRLERDLNSPVRGAGLGLAICRQLIHNMGGNIWVESSGIPGEGSHFVFTLPLCQEQEFLIPLANDAPASTLRVRQPEMM